MIRDGDRRMVPGVFQDSLVRESITIQISCLAPIRLLQTIVFERSSGPLLACASQWFRNYCTVCYLTEPRRDGSKLIVTLSDHVCRFCVLSLTLSSLDSGHQGTTNPKQSLLEPPTDNNLLRYFSQRLLRGGIRSLPSLAFLQSFYNTSLPY